MQRRDDKVPKVEADEKSSIYYWDFVSSESDLRLKMLRKMNPMFGSVDAGDKSRKYSGDESLKGSRPMFCMATKTAILSDQDGTSNETILEELSKRQHKISVLTLYEFS